MQVQNMYLFTVMDSLAFFCGRSSSVHEVAVQPSLENDSLFANTAQCNQKMSIPGKILFVFHSCVSHSFLSGTLLACTASIGTALLLSFYRDDSFWQGKPLAVALGTPLLCVCFFIVSPLQKQNKSLERLPLV